MTSQSSYLPHPKSKSFRRLVGAAGMVAPTLHSITDVMEWRSGGFTEAQLWLNLAAFLPMPFLLLGIYVVVYPRPNAICLLGALLYGASFAYFTYTTIYAIERNVPDYASLWDQLGAQYTLAGILMVLGGCIFAIETVRSSALPKIAILMFLLGILINLGLAILPAPDILQIFGSAVRNAGLFLMGYYIVKKNLTGA